VVAGRGRSAAGTGRDGVSTLASPHRVRPEGGLRWLADAYARYAHLVHAQLTALDENDLERVASLASERDALASEIDGRNAAEAAVRGVTDRLVDDVRASLQRAADADRALRRRLRELRGEAMDAVRANEGQAEKAVSAARSYTAAAAAGTRLDVSL
jgi:hypothetical protein